MSSGWSYSLNCLLCRSKLLSIILGDRQEYADEICDRISSLRSHMSETPRERRELICIEQISPQAAKGPSSAILQANLYHLDEMEYLVTRGLGKYI